MKQVDLSRNERVAQLTELFQTVSSLKDPQAVQREFSRRLTLTSRVQGYMGVSKRGLDDGQYKITRVMLDEHALQANATNPWAQWDEIPTHTGGLVGELIATPVPRLFTEFFLRGDPALADTLADFGSAMVCPLFDDGQALNWAFMFRSEPNAFTEEELVEFMMRGNAVGRMTRNLVIQQQIEALNTRLRDQLDQIAAIQKSLLPERLPHIPRLSLAASYLTSDVAGGDFYDFFPLEGDQWGFCVADVSGHGAGAATVVAMMSAMLHGSDERHRGPAAVLRHLNRQLTEKRIESNFVTALFGAWNPSERRLVISNAGHHLPSLRRATGVVEQIEGGHDIPLGILEDVGYEQVDVVLDPCDTVVLYTDGITEAFSPPPNREMFGLARLHDALSHCSGAPECVIDSIHEWLYRHTGARTRDDDQTIVAMRVGDD
jgi:sigma-B regulation protein RsbU (phosphoserine phosphatase)